MTKDFAKELQDLIETHRKDGDQQAISTILQHHADQVSKEDLWPAAAKASEEAQKAQGIQPPRPTEGEMKHALAAEEAAKGGRAIGLESDVVAPTKPEDMQPIEPADVVVNVPESEKPKAEKEPKSKR